MRSFFHAIAIPPSTAGVKILSYAESPSYLIMFLLLPHICWPFKGPGHSRAAQLAARLSQISPVHRLTSRRVSRPTRPSIKRNIKAPVRRSTLSFREILMIDGKPHHFHINSDPRRVHGMCSAFYSRSIINPRINNNKFTAPS